MKARCLLLLLAGLLVITGCIEYSRQTLSYRYDTTADVLHIFQDYQGIFGANNSTKLDPEEIEQLASVMKGGRTFFFNNWISEYNRADLEELLKKPKGEVDANEEGEQAFRSLAELAIANIQVENVGFYKNQEGQLCGAQKVTIRQCSKVIAALNRVMPHVFRSQIEEENLPEPAKGLMLKIANDMKFIQLDGNRLEVRFPMNEEGFQEFSSTPQARGIRASGGTFIMADGTLIVSLGERDARSVSVTLPFSQKTYAPNTLAEAQRYGIKKSFDARNAAAEFLTNQTTENQ